MSLVDVLLEGDEKPGVRLVYGVATDVNTVAVGNSTAAVTLPALSTVVSGDYCAVLVSGADRLILGAVGAASTVADRTAVTTDGSGEATVSFPDTFAATPAVVANVDITTTGDVTWWVTTVSTTSFTVKARLNGSVYTGSAAVDWVAVGVLA